MTWDTERFSEVDYSEAMKISPGPGIYQTSLTKTNTETLRTPEGEKKSCTPKYKSKTFGTQSKITKKQKTKRSDIGQQLYSRMSEITGRAHQNIEKVVVNMLHVFMKVEKNYERKNGRLKEKLLGVNSAVSTL